MMDRNNHEITEEQQINVLKFMEAVDTQDYQWCLQQLQTHNFILQAAINATFNRQENANQTKQIESLIQGSIYDNQSIEERAYSERRRLYSQRGCLYSFFRRVVHCSCLKQLGRMTGHYYRKIKWKMGPSQTFQKLYGSELCQQYCMGNIYQLQDFEYQISQQIRNSVSRIKPIMLIISSDTAIDDLKTLINLQIARNFRLIGATQAQITHELSINNSKTGLKSIYQRLRHQLKPIIVIYYVQLSGRVDIIYYQTNCTKQLQSDLVQRISDYLQRTVINQQYITQLTNTPYSQRLFTTLSDQDDNQNEEIDSSKQIALLRQQNDLYNEIEEKYAYQKKMEQIETERVKEIQEERVIRKMSIPQEPNSTQNTIKCKFRCPDGSQILRIFPDDEQVQLLYNWAEVNDEIQFENQVSRNFDLFVGYPPTTLSNLKQSRLKEVFDEAIVNIMIRQL